MEHWVQMERTLNTEQEATDPPKKIQKEQDEGKEGKRENASNTGKYRPTI